MDEARTIIGTPREWAQDLGVATAIGLFLGVIGPFGSFYGGPIELRVPYWVGNMWIGFIILASTTRLCIVAAQRLDVPIWFALALGVMAGSLPLCFAIALFSSKVWPGAHGHASNLLEMYGQTLAIAEPCAFGYYWLGSLKRQRPPLLSTSADSCPPPAPEAAAAVAPDASGDAGPPSGRTSAFLDRLPPRLGRALIALQMEDHYVRAHTDRGSDLILRSLKDVIAELDAVEGMQVHRSWWVAKDAVAGSAPNGRSLVLKLRNGLEAPVSRASVAKLKAAGWLPDV